MTECVVKLADITGGELDVEPAIDAISECQPTSVIVVMARGRETRSYIDIRQEDQGSLYLELAMCQQALIKAAEERQE